MKIVKQIIFRKYLKITIKKEDIKKGSLDEKLLEQYLELERKIKIKEGKQAIEEETVTLPNRHLVSSEGVIIFFL